MSEIKTLDVEVDFPDRLDVDVDFGQTLTKIVAPEHYMGPFEFYPSDKDQVIPVKEKTPVEDICVKGITGEKTITQNGTYNTLEDKTVNVDVQPDLRPLSVSENGSYEPDGFDGFSQVSVDVPDKVLISESVLAEDKTSETVHEKYWIENYLPEEQEQDALYVIEFENNNAPNYAVEKLLVGGSRGSGFDDYNGCLIIRRDNGVNMRYAVNFQTMYLNNTRTCAASIGTVIKVYKLRYAF